MDSRDEDRADYRLEDTNFSARFGFKPARHTSAGVLAGWLESKIAPGTDPQFPSFEGISGTDHFYAGAFFDFDYRDNAGNPRAGGRYAAQWTTHQDRKLALYGFSRYDVEVQQYLPFFNQRRVIALRGKTTLTRAAGGQQVPFYMQPALGGSEDLRGFSELRFRDNNMVVLNAEYRWEAFSGLDLALFGDAGQVAERPRDIDLTDLKTSYGFGFRFNSSNSVFLRADFGFSSEGSRVFLKFGHVF
jgi:outer membrane protein assembly factor BamA